jgi:putative ABC transport system ATP-binding protein
LAALPAWQVGAGETALLLGPSGSGKTTVLNALAGFVRPSAGRVRVAGQDIGALKAAALDRFRGATIGFVFQTLRLVRSLTLDQNLGLALRLAGKPLDKDRIRHALDRVGVGHLGHANVRRLSVGEAQRGAIARAIVTQPKLILADEPTSALDDDSAEAAFALLTGEAAALGASLIIATHDGRIKSRIANQLILSKQP